MTLRMSPYYTRAANLSKEHLRDRSPQVAASREGQTAALVLTKAPFLLINNYLTYRRVFRIPF